MVRGWIDALVVVPLIAGACVLGNPEFTPAGESEASTGTESGASASMSSTSAASGTTGASTSPTAPAGS